MSARRLLTLGLSSAAAKLTVFMPVELAEKFEYHEIPAVYGNYGSIPYGFSQVSQSHPSYFDRWESCTSMSQTQMDARKM